MTPFLLDYICCPETQEELFLSDAQYDEDGNVAAGNLATPSGKVYPIINGIPRFMDDKLLWSVSSFGDEWNYFNFVDFKENWLNHTVKNTFGSIEVFEDKLIVDAGGGSGAQTRWFLEAGAKHVILLELSHSVDDVVSRNLVGFKNVDVIQCSIDKPPLRLGSVDGIIYCHNVIQHTPSVEKTAVALFERLAPGGEFVFNCYQLNDQGVFRWIRWYLVYQPLRAVLRRMPFGIILAYSRFMASLRLVPGLGFVLEKLLLVAQGDVPVIPGEGFWARFQRRFRVAVLNTFDAYGAHEFQHHKSDDEIRELIAKLQPDASKIWNVDKYFRRPQVIGCALRVFR